MPTKPRLASLIALVVLLLPTAVVRAADYDFDSFASTMSVQRDGRVDVVETLTVTFPSPRHGIYRVIPTHYQEQDGQERLLTISDVSVHDGAGQTLTTAINNDEALTIRIGDANRTVSGEQTYVIHYVVSGALVAYDDVDELYWNVTGSEWDTAPQRVTTTISFPSDVSVSSQALRLSCYSGVYQSTEKDCQISVLGQSVTATAQDNFLTVAVGWPKGLVTVPEPTYVSSTSTMVKEQPLGGIFWGLPVAAFIFMFWRWRNYGRDPKGRGTVVPEYQPPKDLRAAEMGMLLASWVDNSALSAAIVELAVQGHIKIIEVVEERFGPDRKTFRLERQVKSTGELRGWEEALLTALFKHGYTTTEDDLKQRFYKDKKQVTGLVEDWLIDQKYFASHPGQTRAVWMFVGGVLIVAGFQFLGLGLPTLLTGAIMMIFGWLMPKRTPKGVEALDVAKGFKLFLSTAEKYRLTWQEQEGIFEKYLPYAMVFGVADKWAKEFAAVHAEPVHPAWYIGPSLINFNAVDFASRMNALSHQMAVVAAPKGSGSSGGGFSGGGFGGGGGGSW